MNFVKSWGFCVFFSFAASFPQCGDILKADIEVDKSPGKGDEGESYSRKKGGAIPQTYLPQARGSRMQGRDPRSRGDHVLYSRLLGTQCQLKRPEKPSLRKGCIPVFSNFGLNLLSLILKLFSLVWI